MLFSHPFTAIITGATKSGKTEWLTKLIRHREQMVDPRVSRVLYCYGELNPKILSLKVNDGVEIHHGIPSEEMVRGSSSSSSRANIHNSGETIGSGGNDDDGDQKLLLVLD